MTLRVLLDFDAFCTRVAAELDLRDIELRRGARLVEDLGCDSLLVFELVLVVEELVGATLPNELIGQILTVDDLYDVYSIRVTQH